MAFWKNRHFRTLLLAVLATVTFVGGAILSFDVDPKELLEFFLLSLLMVGVMALAATLLVALLRAINKRR